MKSHLKSAALLAATFCLPFSGGAAFAATVPIGAIFDSAITIPEDGATTTLDYTLTNNTTSAITIGGGGEGFVLVSLHPFIVTTGDASDGISFGALDLFGTCGGVSLAPGGTCIGHVNITVDNGAGETDADTGVTKIFAEFTFSGLNTGELSTGGLFTTITVTDPAITPLPAALPLFGTGLGALGLLGWRRKRKAQAVA
jgi:hypothetical protein